MIRQIVGILTLALGLVIWAAGCVTVRQEPDLVMPAKPQITFGVCQAQYICLTDADADKLLKWIQSLDAFEAARQRVLKPEGGK